MIFKYDHWSVHLCSLRLNFDFHPFHTDPIMHYDDQIINSQSFWTDKKELASYKWENTFTIVISTRWRSNFFPRCPRCSCNNTKVLGLYHVSQIVFGYHRCQICAKRGIQMKMVYNYCINNTSLLLLDNAFVTGETGNI